jgi:saccharopine dehydrogenase-like NADP-dependent oxidoreductase
VNKVIILGAGKIGAKIAAFLHHSGRYHVCVADKYQAALDRLTAKLPIEVRQLDVSSQSEVEKTIKGWDNVVSACSFDVNPAIAAAALKQGLSYFDLTEDVATTDSIRQIAKDAKPGQVFMPQCGLAPGFIGILGHHLAQQFDSIDSIKMRVGALPKYPSNALLYNLTWSTEGLINEYCNPCQAIHKGENTEVLALEGLESFSLDGTEYEAFNTSGGLGTLCETLAGKVQEMTYKTVRYPGHQYLMNFLVNDLRLHDVQGRQQLKSILERAVPITYQDVVLTLVTVTGQRNGQFEQVTDVRKIYHQTLFGEIWSSIQITTAAGICAVIDLHAEKQLAIKQGFMGVEQVPFEQFIANEFGAYYQEH